MSDLSNLFKDAAYSIKSVVSPVIIEKDVASQIPGVPDKQHIIRVIDRARREEVGVAVGGDLHGQVVYVQHSKGFTIYASEHEKEMRKALADIAEKNPHMKNSLELLGRAVEATREILQPNHQQQEPLDQDDPIKNPVNSPLFDRNNSLEENPTRDPKGLAPAKSVNGKSL